MYSTVKYVGLPHMMFSVNMHMDVSRVILKYLYLYLYFFSAVKTRKEFLCCSFPFNSLKQKEKLCLHFSEFQSNGTIWSSSFHFLFPFFCGELVVNLFLAWAALPLDSFLLICLFYAHAQWSFSSFLFAGIPRGTRLHSCWRSEEKKIRRKGEKEGNFQSCSRGFCSESTVKAKEKKSLLWHHLTKVSVMFAGAAETLTVSVCHVWVMYWRDWGTFFRLCCLIFVFVFSQDAFEW